MASRRPTVHTLVLVLVLQAMIARAQTPQEPYAELQMKMSMLQERNSPCKDTDGTKYTTSRLVDRCMEQERIVIDGQRRLLSFCHVRDGDGAECKAPSCRNTLVPEVFQDPSTGKPKSYDEPNFFVFQKKQEIQECMFSADTNHLRNEDFLARVQRTVHGEPSTGSCALLADKLCTAFGANQSRTSIEKSECCALTELPNSWVLESPELFSGWCGSGYRSGNEQCDDGNLNYCCGSFIDGNGDPYFECNEGTVKPCPVHGRIDKDQYDGDGCNKFCEVESADGWSCQAGAVRDGYGGPTPDLCTCNCDCAYKCTCQDPRQKARCRVDSFGSQVRPFSFEKNAVGNKETDMVTNETDMVTNE